MNVIGSAAIGVLGALPLPQEARLLLITGLLGGFTTFSAFSLEVELLWHRAPWTAVLYVALSSRSASPPARCALHWRGVSPDRRNPTASGPFPPDNPHATV